jgi:putative lipoic acid-binding regulatory protein
MSSQCGGISRTATTMSEDSLFDFPCHVPIKIFGRNELGFRSAALLIVRTHFPALDEALVAEQLSREGRYLSLTVTVWAESRAQLDAVYGELSASPDILMAL